MNDSTDEMAPLTSDLAAAARSLDIPPGDPAAAVRRGGRRRQRQRRGLTGLAVVALVATVAGAVAVLDKPSAEIKVATSAGLSRGEVGVSWRAVSPDSGLGYSATLDTSAPLYALSTAAGQKDLKDGVPRVLWRSDDGIEWTAVSSSISDLFLSDLAGTDDRVYAVGTGPASAALAGGGRPVAPLIVGWSDDGAKTWDKARLPIDLESLAGKMLRLTVMSPQVVSNAKGTVIAGVLDGAVNVPALLPEGVTAPNGWATTATGVDVLGPEKDSVCPAGTVTPEKLKANMSQEVRAVTGDAEKVAEVYPTTCIPENVDMSAVTRDTLVQVSPQDARGVVASYTWAQLRVDGDMLAAVRRQPVLFVAGAGSTDFSRVDLPALDPVNGPVLLDAGDGGFDMVATTSTSASYKAMEGGQVVQLHSADGRSWTASPAGVGAVWATAAGRVAGTPTIVGQSPEGASVLRSTDGGWASTSLSSILSDSPSGDRVSLMNAAIGPFGIVATVAVSPESPADKANLDRPMPMDERVLVSRDGVTWQEFKMDDLAGRPVRNVIRSAVVGHRAVVTVSVKPDAGDGPAQLVLVGTPT